MDEVTVTQADRDAAVGYAKEVGWCIDLDHLAERSDTPIAKAFASHRIAATADLRARIAEMEALLDWFHARRFVLQSKFEWYGPQDTADALRETLAKIDALKGTQP